MPAVKRTPPLLAKGVYMANMPFTIPNDTIFTCVALRGFEDLVSLGIDVFKKYYEPAGLDSATYLADKQLRANIVTLVSPAGAYIYLPDTYISKYPSQGQVNYQHAVLSVSLGALPDYIDLTFAGTQIANVVGDIIGVTPTVKVNVAASSGVVTPEQHEVNEAARSAALKMQTTDHAKLLVLQNQLSALQQKYTAMEAILLSHNLIT